MLDTRLQAQLPKLVNALPLPASTLLILIGQVLCKAFRNALALAALLWNKVVRHWNVIQNASGKAGNSGTTC